MTYHVFILMSKIVGESLLGVAGIELLAKQFHVAGVLLIACGTLKLVQYGVRLVHHVDA